jgi:hypothetical protein
MPDTDKGYDFEHLYDRKGVEVGWRVVTRGSTLNPSEKRQVRISIDPPGVYEAVLKDGKRVGYRIPPRVWPLYEKDGKQIGGK